MLARESATSPSLVNGGTELNGSLLDFLEERLLPEYWKARVGLMVLHDHQEGRGRGVVGKTIRLRDKEHCKYVATQPCLICGRAPREAHHIRFAQPRALGRKVSDEYTVPVCRLHYRELHRYGDVALMLGRRWGRPAANRTPTLAENSFCRAFVGEHRQSGNEAFPKSRL